MITNFTKGIDGKDLKYCSVIMRINEEYKIIITE